MATQPAILLAILVVTRVRPPQHKLITCASLAIARFAHQNGKLMHTLVAMMLKVGQNGHAVSKVPEIQHATRW